MNFGYPTSKCIELEEIWENDPTFSNLKQFKIDNKLISAYEYLVKRWENKETMYYEELKELSDHYNELQKEITQVQHNTSNLVVLFIGEIEGLGRKMLEYYCSHRNRFGAHPEPRDMCEKVKLYLLSENFTGQGNTVFRKIKKHYTNFFQKYESPEFYKLYQDILDDYDKKVMYNFNLIKKIQKEMLDLRKKITQLKKAKDDADITYDEEFNYLQQQIINNCVYNNSM